MASVTLSCGLGLNLHTAEANEYRLTADLFLPSAMEIQSARGFEEANSLDAGLMLSSASENAEAKLCNTYAGDFSFRYTPVTKNGVPEVKETEIVFEDIEGDNDFSIVMEHSTGSTELCVRYQEVEAGVFYAKNGNAYGQTSYANAQGMYTTIAANEVYVWYDAEERAVYAGVDPSVKKLVWNMSKTVNDGREVDCTLGEFTTYNVAFRLGGFLKETGSVILYSINDCALDGIILKDSGTPVIYADYSTRGLVGTQYALPNAYAYDLWEGLLKTSCTVTAPNGSVVEVKNGSFVPNVAGEYIVTYETQNTDGKAVTKEYALEVLSEMPTYTCEIYGDIPTEVAVGENIYVPEMIVRGGLNSHETRTATVTAYRNGIKLLVYTGVKSGFDFSFPSVGIYTFVYDAYGEEIEYSVSVQEKMVNLCGNYSCSAFMGDIIDLRAGYVEVDGRKLPFELEVTFPDGNVYTNKKFECAQAGVYTLRATAVSDEKTYVAEETVQVSLRAQDMFSSLSSGASVSYGKSVYSGLEGVRLTATQSYTTFAYEKPIDITKYINQTQEAPTSLYGDSNIVLADNAKPFIEFAVDPLAYGQGAVASGKGGIYVYLTDAEDPTNVLTINIKHQKETSWSYVVAQAGAQSMSGYFNEPDLNVSPLGDMYKNYGFRTNHSFLGKANFSAEKNKISLYYDYEENKLLTKSCQNIKNDNNRPNDTVKDFDNADWAYGPIWSGFKSGKVYLSVGVANISNEVNCMIYSIDGVDLSNEFVECDIEPIITVDLSKNAELRALKGYDYTLPSVKATDCLGNAIDTIRSAVYYETSGKRYNVTAKNGKFHVDKSGKYYVCYRVSDAYGNVGEREIEITALETIAELTASVPISAVATQGMTGEIVRLLATSALSIENSIGQVAVERKVLFGNEEVYTAGDTFVPERAGTYTVKYTAVDYVGRMASAEYSIAVEVNPDPVIVSAEPTYVAFVRGNTYTLYDVYLIDYKASAERIKADIYINGEKYAQKTYTPLAYTEKWDESEKKETLLIEYKYGNETLLSYNVSVKTVYREVLIHDEVFGDYTATRFRADRYFECENGMELQLARGYLSLRSNTDTATATFAQGLDSSSLELVLDIAQEKNVNLEKLNENIRSITIRITDAKDVSKTIVLSIVRDANDETKFFFNGEEGASITGSLTGTSAESFRLILKSKEGTVSDGNTKFELADIKTYENGRAYDGFGERVYVSFALASTDGAPTEIKLLSVNGQAFSVEAKDDTTPPQLIVKDCSGIYDIGTQFTLPTASAVDVFSDTPNVTVTLIYVAADGSKTNLISNFDARKEYTFVFDKLGEYRVTYTATDARNSGKNVAEITFIMTAKSISQPSIELSGEVSATVKVGELVKLPTMNVTFGEESSNNLAYIVCISPSNEYQMLQGGEFTASKRGTYTIRYFALDSYGNYQMLEYKIVCE